MCESTRADVCMCVCVYINAFVNAQPQREQLCKKKNVCYYITSFIGVEGRKSPRRKCDAYLQLLCPSSSATFAKVHQSVSNSKMKNR